MSEPSQSSAARRFMRPSLRQATLILPRTGERVKKSFTLRRPARSNSNGYSDYVDERSALLSGERSSSAYSGRTGAIIRRSKATWDSAYKYATSKTGQGILKCSIAYVLGSCATFVAPISGFLGHNDGKHMVATVTVYFHPARSAGSMVEATLLALVAFFYAAFISFTSMAVSVFFGSQDLLVLGHILVLIIFLGGGLALVGWTKQSLGSPLVNVACSLTSLALITVLTKEGAVQDATFSYVKVFQVLKMVIMGITATTLVNLLIKPISARKELRDDLRNATNSLGDMFTRITRSFLSGSEEELRDSGFVTASNRYKSKFKSLVKNLGEAKYEHYILGTEEEYKIQSRMIKCLERMAQDIGGLRSSAETQFTLIAKSVVEGVELGDSSYFGFASPAVESPSLSIVERRTNILASIDELPEDVDSAAEESGVSTPGNIPHDLQSSLTAADMFSIFISHLGPPMKSLAYTLRDVLDELPFGPPPAYAMMVNSHFRSSLVDANDLFASARKEALALVYKNKIPENASSVEVAADYEEVAASCGYFSSSLQDFAEDMIVYLDILEELKENRTRSPRRRTWNWLKFWRKWGTGNKKSSSNQPSLMAETVEQGLSQEIPGPTHQLNAAQEAGKPDKTRPFRHHVWEALRLFRRDDIKFALKVGVGATLYAMWAFVPATRPVYSHWRGEWGLLSYMLVCSMTIGASNTTGFQRFGGTCVGAVFAIVAWIVAHENPYVLGFLGWLVSLICFYIIVGQGKGPMGRFIFLTYNLSALYAYSLSARDDEDDDDEGGVSPEIWEIVLHRVVAVMAGCIWGIIITRLIWPISARRKFKNGITLLWLRMAIVWKRGPLQALEGFNDSSQASYLDLNEELEMQRFLTHLDTLRASASSEFELRGPFPNKSFKKILDATSRMLDNFHAMNVVIAKDLKASEGEKAILRYTKHEWTQLSWRISHLFSVMASSMKLEYPLNDALPNIEHTRDRLLAKVFEFRKSGEEREKATDEDYELLYAYALVTGQLAQDITVVGQEIEQLYGILNEDDLKLQ
ncbi:hypothetical protein BU16DRAFT_486353 [Lophium mytilinum]|uniref:Integral membrane bound transporter domain-containing protein n=1 Tax=Lophium mytilinum TaxID=390894 RepID=A0A6A6QRJ0_9PEZI|nr:hypothetical protein BU16DRAFT_486353 [Lophium mytilinum]